MNVAKQSERGSPSRSFSSTVDVRAAVVDNRRVPELPAAHGRLLILGRSVRAARTRAGLSQEALADRAGLHRTYVGGVERGERNISMGSLFRLADALGVPPGDLVADL